MSIIHEALKKVETSTLKQPIKEQPRGKTRIAFKVYAVYLAVAVLGFFSANTIFSFFSKPLPKTYPPALNNTLPQQQKSIPASTPPLPALTATPAPTVKKEAPPPLILSGVFFSGEQGYALINNQIVKEGDKISGATVVRISLEGVDLNYEDSDINLNGQSR